MNNPTVDWLSDFNQWLITNLEHTVIITILVIFGLLVLQIVFSLRKRPKETRALLSRSSEEIAKSMMCVYYTQRLNALISQQKKQITAPVIVDADQVAEVQAEQSTCPISNTSNLLRHRSQEVVLKNNLRPFDPEVAKNFILLGNLNLVIAVLRLSGENLGIDSLDEDTWKQLTGDEKVLKKIWPMVCLLTKK